MSDQATPDNPYVLRPKGTISVTNAGDFRNDLRDAIDAGHHDLRIDLSDVDMIDSTGLSIFVQCYQTLSEHSGSMTVVTPDANIQKLFTMMGLDQHFTVAAA